jgi:hypothetical protein
LSHAKLSLVESMATIVLDWSARAFGGFSGSGQGCEVRHCCGSPWSLRALVIDSTILCLERSDKVLCVYRDADGIRETKGRARARLSGVLNVRNPTRSKYCWMWLAFHAVSIIDCSMSERA